MTATNKKLIPHEHAEQVALFTWLKAAHPNLLAFAIPNGGHRLPKVAMELKAEGVLKGVADVFVAQPSGSYHGLFLELKRVKYGVVSAEQKVFLERASNNGYMAVVAKGFLEAKKIIENYLALGLNKKH